SMDGDSMDMGAMVMQQIMSLDLPAGETVELKPGGYHVMLIDLAAPLEIGQTFDLTLDFETAPDRVVTVEVRDDAP
ncbi:MAG: copper chaperone PCu(A)C, partial [Ilumatobacteraceae bacterium]